MRRQEIFNNCKTCGAKFKTIKATINRDYCSRKCSDIGRRKHGMYGTRFYKIWRKMKDRTKFKECDRHYKYYIGVNICDNWNEFIGFHSDMYKKYLDHSKKHGEKNTTIDRIDSSLGYCLENCRWATYKVQNNNRRSFS